MTWLKVICYILTIALALYGFVLCRKQHRILNEAQRMLDEIKEDPQP